MQDLRFAVRTLRKQPLFTLVAILTLTLGIGANTAIFSLVYQTLLKPLPYANADRLVFVWNSYPLTGLNQASVSIPDYLDRRAQAPAIEDAALFTTRSVSLVAGSQPEQLRALAVTPSFFSTLGRTPLLGRAFKVSEFRGRFVDSPLAARVLATVHPSAVLRAGDEDQRRDAMARFVADLRVVAAEIARAPRARAGSR